MVVHEVNLQTKDCQKKKNKKKRETDLRIRGQLGLQELIPGQASASIISLLP